MNELKITKLNSGGIITNYYCSSKCKHCLYNCSPSWEKKYINPDTARSILKKIREMGCKSIHIGGGEPFLNFDALKKFLETVSDENIYIEYLETNSSWFKDKSSAIEILKSLKARNVKSLLISMDPFHNEFVPFVKVKSLIETCKLTDMSVFPWVETFYDDINNFDENKTHQLREYIATYGDSYLREIPSRIWIHPGGRVIETFKNSYELKAVDEIIEKSENCNELSDTSHFHFDLFGNYIPGLCSGLSINHRDLGKPITEEKYPLITILYNFGIKGLLHFAKKEFKFEASSAYLSKCHLCFDIRKFLVQKKVFSKELQPDEFYTNF